MSLTKADYYKRGQHNAAAERGEPGQHTGPKWDAPAPGTWQRNAFMEGYAALPPPPPRVVQKENAALAAVIRITHPADEYFSSWPAGAREHVRRMAFDIADETNDARRQRLLKAIGRVCRRHERPEAYERAPS